MKEIDLYKILYDSIITSGIWKILLIIISLNILLFFFKILFQKLRKYFSYGFRKLLNKDVNLNYNKNDQIIISDYYKKRNFFTNREDIFFKKLSFILFGKTSRYIIFSKTRVVDIIGANAGNIEAWNRISRWHFDYVICDSLLGFEAVMIIELDDESHQDESVQYRDNKKNEICKYIGLPLIRFDINYTEDSIKEKLNDILKINFKA